VELTTERLILRDFVADDWPALLLYRANPAYHRFYPSTEGSEEDAREFVAMFLGHQQAQPRIKFQLAVTLKESGQLIGNCGVRLKEPGALEADIGYELAPEQWRRGYATEAARAMAAFGFTQLGVHRIWSWCIAENAASARVLEKLGMRQEGRLRENEFFKGRWWDTLIYAILEPEWRARQTASGAPFLPAPLVHKVDALQIPVPDLDAGLSFYRDRLGHEILWRSQTAVGLRMPETDAEIVLQVERANAEVDLLVDSADAAAQRFVAAGGGIVVAPFDIQIGRCVVVRDPWGTELVLLDMSKGAIA
jgi:RimJ/RimL family protein N-acetyltransferase/predicted enzyme related to lactoylglutathione lyase